MPFCFGLLMLYSNFYVSMVTLCTVRVTIRRPISFLSKYYHNLLEPKPIYALNLMQKLNSLFLFHLTSTSKNKKNRLRSIFEVYVIGIYFNFLSRLGHDEKTLLMPSNISQIFKRTSLKTAIVLGINKSHM